MPCLTLLFKKHIVNNFMVISKFTANPLLSWPVAAYFSFVTRVTKQKYFVTEFRAKNRVLLYIPLIY